MNEPKLNTDKCKKMLEKSRFLEFLGGPRDPVGDPLGLPYGVLGGPWGRGNGGEGSGGEWRLAGLGVKLGCMDQLARVGCARTLDLAAVDLPSRRA